MPGQTTERVTGLATGLINFWREASFRTRTESSLDTFVFIIEEMLFTSLDKADNGAFKKNDMFFMLCRIYRPNLVP